MVSSIHKDRLGTMTVSLHVSVTMPAEVITSVLKGNVCKSITTTCITI